MKNFRKKFHVKKYHYFDLLRYSLELSLERIECYVDDLIMTMQRLEIDTCVPKQKILHIQTR